MSNNKTMRCEDVQNCIPDYSIGGLSDDQSAAVQAHLLECAQCAREMRILEAAMEMVESIPQVEPPAGMWNAVYAQIAPELSVKHSFADRIKGFFAPPARVMALGFAVLVLLVITTFGRINMVNTPAMADSQTQEYVEGHVVFASQDAFADRVGLASVTAAEMTGEDLH